MPPQHMQHQQHQPTPPQQAAQPQVVRVFPPVPKYFESYGDKGTGTPHPTALSMDPPQPPKEDLPFRAFREDAKLTEGVPTVESLGYKAMYDVNGDRKIELIALIGKLKEVYAGQLRDLCSKQGVVRDLPEPDANATVDAAEAIPDPVGHELREVYVNIMHLLTEWRFHQAREELIQLLRVHVEAKQRAADELDRAAQTALHELPALVRQSASNGSLGLQGPSAAPDEPSVGR